MTWDHSGAIKSKPFDQKHYAAACQARRQVLKNKTGVYQYRDYFFTIEPTEVKEQYQFVISPQKAGSSNDLSHLKQRLIMEKLTRIFEKQKIIAPHHWVAKLLARYHH